MPLIVCVGEMVPVLLGVWELVSVPVGERVCEGLDEPLGVSVAVVVGVSVWLGVGEGDREADALGSV